MYPDCKTTTQRSQFMTYRSAMRRWWSVPEVRWRVIRIALPRRRRSTGGAWRVAVVMTWSGGPTPAVERFFVVILILVTATTATTDSLEPSCL